MNGLMQVAKYVSLAYKKSKPWAEIPDESCLRSGCHETRLLSGKIEFENMQFDHGPHLLELRRGKKLRCTSCHSQIVQGDHLKVTKETCFLCHFKKSGPEAPVISTCTKCHTEETMLRLSTEGKLRYDHSTVFDKELDCTTCHSGVISGRGDVVESACMNCHFETKQLSKKDDHELMHKMHVTDHKVECMQCHLPINHAIPKGDIDAAADCNSCHPNKHLAQKELYSGAIKINNEKHVNPMFEIGLNCKSCHIFHKQSETSEYTGTTYRAKGESCNKCHGEGFERILKDWGNYTQSKIRSINTYYGKLKTDLKRRGLLKGSAAELMKKASFDIQTVEKGKSVHNIELSDQMLHEAYHTIVDLAKDKKSSVKIPDIGFHTKNIPTECASCHKNIADEEVAVWGVQFSHNNHLNKRNLQCKDCHSNKRKHGELVRKKETCAPCHHTSETSTDCKVCHKLQDEITSGNYPGFDEIEPDIMNEAEVGCTECHGDFEEVVRPNAQICVDCHDDEEYKNEMLSWQNETTSKLKEARGLYFKLLSGKKKFDQNQALKLIQLAENDGSKGVHNHPFIMSVLDSAISIMQSH